MVQTFIRHTLIFISLFLFHTATAQYMVHIAGNDTCSYYGEGVPAWLASFNSPAGICFDAAGNLYIGDGSAGSTNDARVRKINSATGIITTVAGGVHLPIFDTLDNMAATTVDLASAAGIYIDRTGGLLIADGAHNKVKKVDLATGMITTIAGCGAPGYGGDGGPATAAYLAACTGVAVDSANNVYVSAGAAIRKITDATGIISTVAGTGVAGFGGDGGPATGAMLWGGAGLYIDRGSNIYIADQQNHRIRKVDPITGIITTVAGNGTIVFGSDGVPATAAGLGTPGSVAKDNSGNLYISDYSHLRIRRVDSATGIITTYAGDGMFGAGVDSVGDGGPATAARLKSRGICFDTCGNLYFADERCRIRAIALTLPTDSALCGFHYGVGTLGAPAVPIAIGSAALSVFPDPNYGTFIVKLSAAANEEAHIIATNIMGQAIKEINTTTNKETELRLTAPPGIYFISAATRHGRWCGKVVVQ